MISTASETTFWDHGASRRPLARGPSVATPRASPRLSLYQHPKPEPVLKPMPPPQLGLISTPEALT